MQIELSETLKTIYHEAAKNLKGSARRKFMAGIVASMGRGGLSYCNRLFFHLALKATLP
jgi:hypothetical protein